MKNYVAYTLAGVFVFLNLCAQAPAASSNKALTASVSVPLASDLGLEEMGPAPVGMPEAAPLSVVAPDTKTAETVVTQQAAELTKPTEALAKLEVFEKPAIEESAKSAKVPVLGVEQEKAVTPEVKEPAFETEGTEIVAKQSVQEEHAQVKKPDVSEALIVEERQKPAEVLEPTQTEQKPAEVVQKDVIVQQPEITLMPVKEQESKEPVVVQEAAAGILPSEKEARLESPAVGQTKIGALTPQEQRCADTDTLECMPKGLNTVDVDAGGNWVVKRAYWEQTEKTYEKIMKLNNELYEHQMNFVRVRNESDKMTDQAFRELGFQQGQLSELLDKLIEEVKLQQEQQGDLTEQERAFLQELQAKKNDLELMKKNLQTIDELDDALDKVMETVSTQINVCRTYEQKAWDVFKAVGKELNDKKARDLFYSAEGFFKTVEQNRDYIAGSLKQYFERTIDNIKKRLNDVKAAVNQLKTKGTDLMHELNRFIEQEKQKEQAEQAGQDIQREAQKRAQAARKGWFGWSLGLMTDASHMISSWVSRAWGVVTHVTQSVISRVSGWFGKKPRRAAAREPEASPVQQEPVPVPAPVTT